MESPPVGMIAAAIDSLPSVHEWLRKSQVEELHSLGDESLEKLGVSAVTPDFEKGYELGLQTMRKMLATIPAAQEANIEL